MKAGEASPVREAANRRGVPVLELTAIATPDGCRFALTGSDVSANSMNPAARAGAGDDVALVLHTSGTTSKPKLVPLTHRNLLSSAQHIARTLALTPTDRCLNVMPLFHIHGLVGVLLSSLAAGASVACPPRFEATRFFGWLEEFQPTWYSAVPTIHAAILGEAMGNGALTKAHSLRFVRSSSAALPPATMTELERVFGVPAIESYGMTEAAHQMASNPLPPGTRKLGSVGRAAGPEIAILDSDGQLVATGATGEIAIRGPNVTPGYDQNPAANAAAFTDGWFRTGDQGRMDADSYVFVTGRLKEIINRGGEKISPREVDEALLEQPGVAQAVAFALRHATLGEELAAAVVAKPGATLDEFELREALAARFPRFKVPSRIVIVREIPKGPTGKVQRIGLEDRLAAALAIAYEPPQGEAEEAVAAVFAEVLRLPQVGRHDNFFASGGDSIRAVQVLVRLEAELGFQPTPTTVFRRPTPASLARELGRLREERELEALAGALAELPEAEARKLLAAE
jgi:acyl-CoA synthetase (AMP-forming)/AMP-acid ligase II/acyl carrier protein